MIAGLPFISDIYRTEARYDELIKLYADTEDNLRKRISSDIDAICGIYATITSMVALAEFRCLNRKQSKTVSLARA